jgi:predicted PurR-regulated permease PerM
VGSAGGERERSEPESVVIATPRQSPASTAARAPVLDRTLREAHAWALPLVVLLTFFGAAVVAEPLWLALVLGGVMAVSAQRPYELTKDRLGGRSTLAAALVTIAYGVILLGAGSSILIALTDELMRLVTLIDRYGKEYGSAPSVQHILGPSLTHALARVGVDAAQVTAWTQRELESAATFIAASAAIVVRTTSHAVLELIVAFATMYYVLREGPSLAQRAEVILPLEPRHTRALLHEVREVGRSAFLGSLATAVVQGLIAGVGYALFGVPQPVTWAVATALASFLPVVGTLLVWVPLAAYLLLAGHLVSAILLAAWGVFFVTLLADYVIRPRIVGSHGRSHPLLTLVSLLGGIEVFGLVGLVIAPILMSLFVAALRLYERELAT